MKIYKKTLSYNEYSRPNRPIFKVKGIVIHYVGVNSQPNTIVWNYFEGLKNQKASDARYASAHYIVGLKGEITQCIPGDEMAYHVGAISYKAKAMDKLSTYPNNCTIGIEMCHTKEGFTDATVQSAQELTRYLLQKHKLCPCDVYRHYDITGKICPKFYVEDKSLWDDFKKGIV